MKSVLCFGDSITWGSIPGEQGRHAFDVRWPNVLAAALDHRVHVVSDGVRGRTTAYDDYNADCDRNGVRLLPTALYGHGPLDLVIFMLGTNDVKITSVGSAYGAVSGMKRLIEVTQNHSARDGHSRPEILVVAPPKLTGTDHQVIAPLFAERDVEIQKLGSLYADLADDMGCGFFDSASVANASPIDGVHLDAANTMAIGKGIAPIVHVMLGL